MDSLRIAMLAPPAVPVPPPTYAGTERVIAALVDELGRRGHDVTLFGPGNSTIECEVIATVPEALWAQGRGQDLPSFVDITLAEAWSLHERFDVIHSHLEGPGFLFARHCPTPVVSTMHGRLDIAGIPDLIDTFSEIPLVAISESQRRWSPDANWVATIHNGLPLEDEPASDEPGSYLAFVGRLAPEKGVGDAIELARRSRHQLRMAAKMSAPAERRVFDESVQASIEEGIVDFQGELGETERDALYAGALATLMLGAWPEPFGLVAIESMATGTPLIARRAGALTEIVEHGVTGFLVDDLVEAELAVRRAAELDREEIRRRTVARFSAGHMADAYEKVYRAVIEARRGGEPRALAAGSREVEG